jgi:hypothetical protein
MAVVAAIAIVRVTIGAVTRVREIAPVPYVVISAFAAHTETVPVGSTFEILRVATMRRCVDPCGASRSCRQNSEC